MSNKVSRGNAAQFFVAGELCRRGYAAVVTLGNTPNTDILCSNTEGTRFVHIQVKTFAPGHSSCSVGKKAERDYGDRFLWVLAGIPASDASSAFQYFVIPAPVMAKHVAAEYRHWLAAPGRHGQAHRETDVRAVYLPPYKQPPGWDLREYSERWDLIAEKLRA